MNAKLLFVYSALVLLAGFLLLYNLDDRLLWGDEAETALLAHNITRFGVPKATDGKNHITLLGRGYDSNKSDIWVWSPWLDEYVTAASFYIFGKSTFAARLPFALIALLSIVSLSFVAQRFYHNHELTVITVLLCITNAAFLLHARQCRYYALIAFSQIWLLYGGYKLLITAAPKRGGLFLVLALAVQFYCNYIVVLGNVLALCISTVLVRRRYRNSLRNLSICLAGFVLLAIPWLAYAKPWHQSEDIGLGYFTENVLYYLSDIHFYIMPLVLVFIIPVWYLFNRGKQPPGHKEPAMKDIEIFLWILVPAHLIVLGVTPGTFFRYLMPLVPVLIILTSVILVNYVRPLLRYLLILILCCSNAIAVLTAYPLRTSHSVSMPFVQFIREITSSYEDRLEDVVCYLRQNANPDQSLYVLDPEFPLIFYTDMRVIDGRFTKTLNPSDLPDWILSESASGVMPYPPIQLPTPLLSLYEPVVLNVHDTSRHASRPDPDVHVPFTASKMTQLVVYKKIR